jgi:hypothetical protein
VAAAQPVAAQPSLMTAEAAGTEVSNTVHSSLTKAFASFARKLQGRDDVLKSRAAG